MIQSIYVGNLPFNCTKNELKELFSKYGYVHRISIPRDYPSGRPRDFAFIEMEKECAQRAITNLNGFTHEGRILKVNEAKELNDDKFFDTELTEVTHNIRPGIHPRANLSHFSPEEFQIIEKLKLEWFITHGGNEFTLGKNSVYRYCLIKPTVNMQELFNINREILAIFSPYELFEPRSLDAVNYALKHFPPNRVEKICCLLFSKDEHIVHKINDFIKLEQEFQVIIPFAYIEFTNSVDSYFIHNRIKRFFYSRDLFAFQSPLKKDIYFFGRNDLIHNIVSRHKSNENSGLFGLRKTGKTSVIYSIQRVLEREHGISVYIDCQNPALHQRRWNKALFYVISELIKQNKIKYKLAPEDDFTVEKAPTLFEESLQTIYTKINNRNILFVFDEIENITFNISSSNYWEKDYDFIFFWQSIRSAYQKNQGVFTYLLVGTNPMSIEKAIIFKKDNPIFNQVPYQYIEGFSVKDCQEMISKLGGIMGLIFDTIIYSKLVDDFGGHPFLIRQVCSLIHRICDKKRPIQIGKSIYEKAKKEFNDKFVTYIDMILIVLKQHYPEEFQLLTYLALGDNQTFEEYAADVPEYVNHLLGYGIVKKVGNDYEIRIESVKEYLLKINKYKTLNPSLKEIWAEISERRNKLEPKLRKLIKNLFKASLGKTKSQELVLSIFEKNRREKFSGYSIDELFDANLCQIFYDDLRKLILKRWDDIFKNIFNNNRDDFDLDMKIINRYRFDAHAKEISVEELNQFRFSMDRLEKQIGEYVD
ncbi:MAG: hypothetical protein JW870_01880 [Candidatus Delongbacteria bacterium]|nr:hypothetical protein [Candidatus Delongbacteria bacterium]